MWSPKKIQKEISIELHLKVRKLTNKFNNSLIDLEIIKKEIEKTNNNEMLKTEIKQKAGWEKYFKNLEQKRQKN